MRKLFTILLALICLPAFSWEPTEHKVAPGIDLFLTVSPGTAEAAASAVKDLGKVIYQIPSTKDFVIELRPGVNERAAEQRLLKTPGVRSVKSFAEEKMNDIERADYWASYSERQAGSGEEGEEGAEMLDLIRYWTRTRANKDGFVDNAAYYNAIAHRDHMQKAVLSGVSKVDGTWSFVGPKNLTPWRPGRNVGFQATSGRVNSIAYDPTNTNIIYVAAAAGGVWKTLDGGVNWTPLSTGWKYMVVSTIAISPADHNVIYAGTGDFVGYSSRSFGVMKSTDGGATWTNYGADTVGTQPISKIVVDPDNPNIVTATSAYVFTLAGAGGIFQSTDGGATWVKRDAPTGDWCSVSIGVPGADGKRTYWAAGSGNNGGLVYKSTDQGLTWSKVSTPETIKLFTQDVSASKVDANTVYLLCPHLQQGEILKSTDGGVSWKNMNGNGFPNGTTSGPPANNWAQGWADFYLETGAGVDASGNPVDRVAVGLLTVAYSADGGAHWVDIARSYENDALMHTDQHSAAFNPSNPNEALFGGDGGIYRYDFANAQATSLNANLGISQFTQMDVHPVDSRFIVGGTQDNSSPSAWGDLNHWTSLAAFDGGFAAIDPINNYYYTTKQFLGVYQTKTGDIASEKNISPDFTDPMNGFPEPALFVAPIVLSNDAKTLYCATAHQVHAWDASTGKWTFTLGGAPLSGGSGFEIGIHVLATAPTDNLRLYTGASLGEAFMTGDGGKEWFRIDFDTPAAPIGAICPSPSNATDVLMGFQSSGIHHLYRRTETRDPNVPWIDVSGTGANALPDTPVNAIARDYYQPDSIWYVGTDIGVFMTTDGGANWSNMNALGLPSVEVRALKIAERQGWLYAATFGRGIWKIQIVGPNGGATGLQVPSSIRSGGKATGTVTLSEPAPSGGKAITLKSFNPSALTVPAQIVIPQGQAVGNFEISAATLDTVTNVLIESTDGTIERYAAINVLAGADVNALSLNVGTVVGGNAATGTVSIANPAPSAGLTVLLTSSSSSASVPPSVQIPSGSTSANFSVATSGVLSDTTATITADAGAATKTTNLTVKAAGLTSLVLGPSTVTSGAVASGLANLSGSGVTGLRVMLKSSNTAAVVVPGYVQIDSGSKGSFKVITYGVSAPTTVTVTATYKGVVKTDTITVNPAILVSLALNKSSVVGGTNCPAALALNGKTDANGAVVSLSSSNTAAAPVQSSVSIASKGQSVAFNIPTNPVDVLTQVTITATYNGVSKSKQFTVLAPTLSSLSVNPKIVVGGTEVSGKVAVTGPAGPHAITVSLSSSDTTAATVPSTATIGVGTTLANFAITTKPVSSTKAVYIKSTIGSYVKTTPLSVQPPSLTSIVLANSTYQGGKSIVFTLTLNGAAPATGMPVTLSCDHPEILNVVSPETITSGKKSMTFAWGTKSVSQSTVVKITATAGNNTLSASVTITP